MLMSKNDRPARLEYQPNGFRVLVPGNHVICGVSGNSVPLEELRYWSVDDQQPFAGPEEATRRLIGEA
jgi:hypothetical protein